MKKFINEKLLPKALGAYLNSLAYFNPEKSGEKALQIFGTPRKGKIREKDALFLDSFEKETLQYNDLNIQCYKKGNGKLKILFLHGWESNTARWKHLINYIEKKIDCTIYAIDGPAHGASGGVEFNSILYGHFINVVCEHFQPDVLIGHSIGAGSIAYCMSNIKHHTIDKIILMGSPNKFTEIMHSYISIIGLNNKGQKALQSAIVKKYNIQASDYNISEYVKKISSKGLIVHDTEDFISNVKNAKLIADNFKNADLYITEGYGHSLQHHTIFKKIIEFITT